MLSNCNYNVKAVFVGILVACLNIGCASHGPAGEFTPKKSEFQGPVDLSITAEKGQIERTRFQSQSFSQTYEGGQLRHEKTEIVDFYVESKVHRVDEEKKQYTFEITTLEKDGTVNLRGMAFPEEGESLDLVVDSKANVYKAGNYPKGSIFFVPPVALPKKPVSVGDTWVLKKEWVSMASGVPLRVEVVNILKAFYECGVSNLCAEIEVSGAVELAARLGEGMKLKSDIVGRLLVDTKTSSVIWSDIRNLEEIHSKEATVKVRSCLESVLTDPVAKKWLWRNVPDCDPMLPLPETLPGI